MKRLLFLIRFYLFYKPDAEYNPRAINRKENIFETHGEDELGL